MRSSSSRTSLRSSMVAESTPVAARTRSCAPSSDPRRRRFGHAPSCSPATTTVSNSSPTTPDGVVTSTDSSSGLRGERVFRHVRVEHGVEEQAPDRDPGGVRPNRLAAVKRASTPSRLVLASAAVIPLPAPGRTRRSPARCAPRRARAAPRWSSCAACRREARRASSRGGRRCGRCDDRSWRTDRAPPAPRREDHRSAVAAARELLGAKREPQAPQRQPIDAAERRQSAARPRVAAVSAVRPMPTSTTVSSARAARSSRRAVAAHRGSRRNLGERQGAPNAGGLGAASHDRRPSRSTARRAAGGAREAARAIAVSCRPGVSVTASASGRSESGGDRDRAALRPRGRGADAFGDGRGESAQRRPLPVHRIEHEAAHARVAQARRPAGPAHPVRRRGTRWPRHPDRRAAMIAMPRPWSARRIASVDSVASCRSSTITRRSLSTRSPGVVRLDRRDGESGELRRVVGGSGRDALTTATYSSMKSATDAHSARPCRAESSRSRAGVTPNSVARIMKSRSSVRNPRRRRTSGPSSSGHAAPMPSSRSPSSRLAMSTSWSPPVTRRGASLPAARTAPPTISNASELTVRASGPLVATPTTQGASRSRRRVADARVGVSTTSSSGDQPRSSTRSATSSTTSWSCRCPARPERPPTRRRPGRLTARCDASSTGGATGPAPAAARSKPRMPT